MNKNKPAEPEVWTAPADQLPTRMYKDRLFRMIFKEKKEFLELYNAMNHTTYSNMDDLTVTTLENAIYLSMKNDVSYLLYDQLVLYEHQASHNPNMPLRDLLYISNLYSGLTRNKNLYGSRKILIPEPVFVVFYNGTQELPERFVLKLSDLYENPSNDPALDLKTLVLNINAGHNPELMRDCKTLRDYMEFVCRVRKYEKDMKLSNAVEQAITECIKEDILADFLSKNRNEVKAMCIFEYNEERHIQMERKDAWEDGNTAGIQQGIQQGIQRGIQQGVQRGIQQGICKFIELCKDFSATRDETLDKLAQKYDLNREEAENYLCQYW